MISTCHRSFDHIKILSLRQFLFRISLQSFIKTGQYFCAFNQSNFWWRTECLIKSSQILKNNKLFYPIFNIYFTCLTKSYNSAPNSTPVGPPPTIIICLRRLLSVSLIVGSKLFSKLSINRVRIERASDNS